eukprot:RCo040477
MPPKKGGPAPSASQKPSAAKPAPAAGSEPVEGFGGAPVEYPVVTPATLLVAPGLGFTMAAYCGSRPDIPATVRGFLFGRLPLLTVTEAAAPEGSASQPSLPLPPRKTALVSWLEGKTVLQLAAGYEYIMLRCSSGLYGVGRNDFGQLGLPPCAAPVAVPALVEFFIGMRVRTVACGRTHSLVVVETVEFGAAARGAAGRASPMISVSNTTADPGAAAGTSAAGGSAEEGSAASVSGQVLTSLFVCGEGTAGALGLGH